jgi:hypothetical protein
VSDEIFYIPVSALALHVGLSVGQVYKDARAGLLTLTRKAGIRGSIVSGDRANRYIRTKFAGRVSTLTFTTLEAAQ